MASADEDGQMAKPGAANGDMLAGSTADTFFATNPGEVMGTTFWSSSNNQMATVEEEGELMTPMPSCKPVLDDTKLDTPRISLLQQEAEMRAEHQAQARLTMLNLARALDDAHAKQREWQRRLGVEREANSTLHGKIGALQGKLDQALIEEEKRRAEELLRKGFESGNKLFLAMMIEKSREAYKSKVYHEDDDSVSDFGDESVADESIAGSRPGSSMDGPRPTSSRRASSGNLMRRSSTSGGDETRPLSRSMGARANSFAFESQLPIPERRQRSKEFNRKVDKKYRIKGPGDKVFFHWVLKMWRRECEQSKERAEKEEEERKLAEAEEKRKRSMQEEVDKKVGEMADFNTKLTKELEKANEEMERYRKKIKVLERKVETLETESAERDAQQEATIGELRSQLDHAMAELRDRDENIRRLKQELEEAHWRFAKTQADNDVERRQLQDTIRKVTTELHEATILAKYMRETMLKSKRDAAASVSPAKFAELIAQLEQMRDQLNSLRKDYSNLQDDNTDLHSKLEKNRRRLELERQFLPLIRHARGPLGPKMGINVMMSLPGSESNPASCQGSPEMPKKQLNRSQSETGSPMKKGHALTAA